MCCTTSGQAFHRYRDALIEINGGLVYDGYLDVARRFLLKPHDAPRHPRHTQSDFTVTEDVYEADDPHSAELRVF